MRERERGGGGEESCLAPAMREVRKVVKGRKMCQVTNSQRLGLLAESEYIFVCFCFSLAPSLISLMVSVDVKHHVYLL